MSGYQSNRILFRLFLASFSSEIREIAWNHFENNELFVAFKPSGMIHQEKTR